MCLHCHRRASDAPSIAITTPGRAVRDTVIQPLSHLQEKSCSCKGVRCMHAIVYVMHGIMQCMRGIAQCTRFIPQCMCMHGIVQCKLAMHGRCINQSQLYSACTALLVCGSDDSHDHCVALLGSTRGVYYRPQVIQVMILLNKPVLGLNS